MPGALAGQDSTWTQVALGPQYGAGGLRRFLFGSDYRDLWTLPIRVPYLDLATTAGGLTPTTAGGGIQTKSLWFRGADGLDYGFRSADKRLANVPPVLQGTLVERLALDQTSAQHPAAPAIVAALAEAAGLLTTTPVLVVLPDDARLGAFRSEFGNVAGFFERRATVAPPGFAGALEIIGSGRLLDRLAADPSERVDARTFLLARLFDLWIGDRDRHRGQWTWARLPDHPAGWVPIPEDRDQAFVRFDGVVLGLVRQITGQYVRFEAGALLPFDDTYSHVVGVAWSGRELDRRLLVGLERAVWDSVVSVLTVRLADAVIDAAVQRQPPEYAASNAAWLAGRLKARRDRLPAFADRFYRLLAAEPELHGSDADDLVVIEAQPDRGVHVTMAPRDRPDAVGFQRTFEAGETGDLRLFLRRGADSVVVRGGRSGIGLRVVAGADAVVVDSAAGTALRVYARDGAPRVTGVRRVAVDRRSRRPPYQVREGALPPRDWGHQWDPAVLLAFAPDVGAVVAAGPRYTRYGFWRYPYAYALQARAGIATGPPTAVGDLRLTAYRVNSAVRADLYVRGSGIEMLRYHGLGNDVPLTASSDEFYRVTRREFELTPTVTVPLGGAALRFGPTAQYARMTLDSTRLVGQTQPYGSGNFGQVGLLGEFTVAVGDRGGAPVLGGALRAAARVFPPLWDVDSTFAAFHGEAVAYFGVRASPLRPVLALRAGGKTTIGPYPFYEAAFLGDQRTVRLGRQNRYGGDAALWGNAELRLRLAPVTLLVPGELGVLGLADVGRVFLEGETSNTWHTAVGGGLWLALLDPGNVLSFTVARSAERTAVYVRFGFAY